MKMKMILAVTLLAALTACGGGGKKSPLWLLALAGGGSGSGSGSTSTQLSPATSPSPTDVSNYTGPNSPASPEVPTNVTVATTIVPQDSGNTPSNSGSTETNSGSNGTSGSGETPAATTGTTTPTTTGSTTPTTTTGGSTEGTPGTSQTDPSVVAVPVSETTQTPVAPSTPAPEVPNGSITQPVQVTIVAEDKNETSDFHFQTTKDIAVKITVTDNNGPVGGALVQISENTTANGNVVYQSVTDSSGNTTGKITVPTSTPDVNLQVTISNGVTTQEIPVTNVSEINRKIEVKGEVSAAPSNDSDGDGVANQADEFPNDPTLARSIYPYGARFAVIAYEDLFPTAGDSDFNDYAAKVSYRQYINASGKIVKLGANIEHIARGAGYDHQLFLRLPVDATYTSKVYDGTGKLYSEKSVTINAGQSVDIFNGLSSKKTIAGSNSKKNDSTIYKGFRSEVTISFKSPVSSDALGSAPYDLYIKVLSTNREVHFPRLYKETGTDNKSDKKKNEDATGDLYMDSNGFPWAIAIPQEFNWPVESTKMETSYPDFKTWYTSGGTQKTDWYTRPVTSNVFPYFKLSGGSLAGYIMQGASGYGVLVLIFAVGVIGYVAAHLYQRKRA